MIAARGAAVEWSNVSCLKVMPRSGDRRFSWFNCSFHLPRGFRLKVLYGFCLTSYIWIVREMFRGHLPPLSVVVRQGGIQLMPTGVRQWAWAIFIASEPGTTGIRPVWFGDSHRAPLR